MDEQRAACVGKSDGASCSDGNACNGLETCQGGICRAGTPPSCDDGSACTADSCDAVLGCRHVPLPAGTSCSDGNACNGAETCNASGQCQAGTPPSCDDGNACTADSCDAQLGCRHEPLEPSACAIEPLLSCVLAPSGGGPWRAVFGYRNPQSENSRMPIGTSNGFVPEPMDRGQPEWFLAGPAAQPAAFTVEFDGGPLTWRVGDRTVTASSAIDTSATCTHRPDGDEGEEVEIGGVRYPIAIDVVKVASAGVLGTGSNNPSGSEVALGTMPGELVVGRDGSAAYSLPLWVPPGRNGLQPSLALTYNSKAGNGPLGVGWALGGLSRITRCPRNLNNSDRYAPVTFTWDDLYCLDGNPLVLVSGLYGADAEYRTRNNGFSKIRSFAGSPADSPMGPVRFEVRSRSGVIMTFERQAHATRCETTPNEESPYAPTETCVAVSYVWPLSRVEDRFGNAMVISYGDQAQVPDAVQPGSELLPREIAYNRNDRHGLPATRFVVFKYDQTDRPDPIERFVGGHRTVITTRLASVRMEAPNPTGRALVRRYNLTYENNSITGRSLLRSVEECDSANVCRPPTTFEWELGDMGFEPDATPGNTAAVKGKHVIGDVSGPFGPGSAPDGIADIVFWSGTSDSQAPRRLELLAGNGDGTFNGPYLLDTVTFEGNEEWGGDAVPVLMDMNGDGRPEVIYNKRWMEIQESGNRSGIRQRAVYVNVATAQRIDSDGQNFPVVTSMFVDITGDGIPDELRGTRWRRGTVSPGYAHLTTPLEDLAHPELMFNPALRTVAEMDGDGVPEAVFAGYVWARPEVAARRVSHRSGERSNLKGFFLDVNGDGLTDLVQPSVTSLGPSESVDVALNGGANMAARPVTFAQTDMLRIYGPERPPGHLKCFDEGSPHVMTTPPRVITTDFDLDGRPDLVVSTKTGECDRRATVTVLRWRHRAFQVETTDLPLGGSFHDLDGDGLEDYTYIPGNTLRWRKRKGKRPDVLKKVTNGLGATARVEYAQISAVTVPPVYTTTVACKTDVHQRCVVRGSQVVRALFRDNGAGENETAYRYEDLVADVLPGGGAYFRRIVAEDRRRGRLTESRYHLGSPNDPGFAQFRFIWGGLLEEEVVTTPREQTFERPHTTKTTMTWKFDTFAGGRSYALRPRVVTVTYDDAVSPDFQPERTTTTTYVYTPDDFGNIQRKTEVTAATRPDRHGRTESITTVNEFSYFNDPATWIVGRATFEKTTVTSASNGRQIWRQRTATVDPDTGAVESEVRTVSDGGGGSLTTAYGRTRYGLIESETRTATGEAPRTIRIEHDRAEHMYPRRIVNALGHVEEVVHDPALGVALWARDANGAITRTRVDRFGRPLRIVRPSGAVTELVYERGTLLGAATQNVRRTSTGEAPVVAMGDRLGREVATSVANARGQWTTSRRFYDALGRPRQEDLPYEETAPGSGTRPEGGAAAPAGVATFEYDELDRLVQVNRADGHVERTIIRDREREFVDARNNAHLTYLDDLGRTIETASVGVDNAVINQVKFTYWPEGQPATVRDQRGNVTAMEYDGLGRRTKLVDPDSGMTTTVFNAFGEARTITDASNASIVTTFDELGRPRTRLDDDGTTAFGYDTARGGIGRLSHAVSADGTVTRMAYDGLGRVVAQSQVVEGVALATSQTYEPGTDRVKTIRYPDVGSPGGAVVTQVSYEYHPITGAVAAVKDPSGLTYYAVTERDHLGRRSAEYFGNGVETRRTYDPLTGRLDALWTTNSTTYLQDFTYEYDPNGNLRLRRDSTNTALPEGERFTYDAINRLESWYAPGPGPAPAESGPWRVTYALDLLGNMTDRIVHERPPFGGAQEITEHVQYDYPTAAAARPHAVRGKTTVVGAVAGDDGAFAYDPRGFQTGRPGATVDYRTDGLPRSITRGSATTTFRYSATGERVFKGRAMGTVQEESTIYLSGLYEKRNEHGSITHVFHIRAGLHLVAQLERSGAAPGAPTYRYLHQDHLTSVSLVTSSDGSLYARDAFEPYGGRYERGSVPRLAAVGVGSAGSVTRGFTGHEGDADLDLVNMVGRLYDPRTARFLSPDPIVADPSNAQAYNRYAYVLNNPLRYFDPTGYEAQEPERGSPPDGYRSWDEYEDAMWMARETAEQRENWYRDQMFEAEAASWAAMVGEEFNAEFVAEADMYGDWRRAMAMQQEARFAAKPGAGIDEAGDAKGPGQGAMLPEPGLKPSFLQLDDLSPKGLYKLGAALVMGVVKLFAKEGGERVLKEGAERLATEAAPRFVKHHTVPREILKGLPDDVANNPLVRGRAGAPNRWSIPEHLHKAIHKGPGGGAYNEAFKARIRALGRDPTVDDVLRIRDDLVRRFGLEIYRP